MGDRPKRRPLQAADAQHGTGLAAVRLRARMAAVQARRTCAAWPVARGHGGVGVRGPAQRCECAAAVVRFSAEAYRARGVAHSGSAMWRQAGREHGQRGHVTISIAGTTCAEAGGRAESAHRAALGGAVACGDGARGWRSGAWHVTGARGHGCTWPWSGGAWCRARVLAETAAGNSVMADSPFFV